MINSLNFRQNINNANTIQATPRSLKTSVALRAQPEKDGVCFGAHNLENCTEALLENFYPRNTTISTISPINILKKSGSDWKSTTAYLAKTGKKEYYFTPSSYGLAVFSDKNKLLGDIRDLDSEEWSSEEWGLNFNDNTKLSKIGKYLRIHHLDASYEYGYKGVGTALIQAAIKESKKLGLDGQLRVTAYNDKDFMKGSPIPFYAKMGFVLLDNPDLSKDELIKEYKYGNPSKGMILLTQENLEKLRTPKIPEPTQIEISLGRKIASFFTR